MSDHQRYARSQQTLKVLSFQGVVWTGVSERPVVVPFSMCEQNHVINDEALPGALRPGGRANLRTPI